MYYPDEILDLVRSANDIVDVIGQSVQLKKSGSRYVGLCPFHNEKTPSFSVNQQNQLFYCFGCHKGGNVITFVEEYDNMTFTEAVQYLAQRAGITLPERPQSAAERRERDVKAQLLDLNRLAAGYFYYMLRSPQGKAGMDYFRKRQLSDETMRSFGLGFAPAGSDGLYRYLKGKGVTDDLLRQSGLMNVDEKRGRMYDKFWNRVIFPIMDMNSRVIGFGGRVMGDGKPKYLNSPQSLVFDKSRNLYGLNVARKTKENRFILCEGYMDVIAMHQAGFTYAVASLGTALTQQHCTILRRFTKNVVLSYDSDNAGVNAAMRAIPMLRLAGISPSILRLEPYKDPDEFIKALGHDAFQERVDQAENAFLFETRIMQRSYNMADPDQAAAFYDAVAGLIASFDDVFLRKGYIAMAAQEYGLEERDLSDRVVRKLQTGAVDQRYQAARTEAGYSGSRSASGYGAGTGSRSASAYGAGTGSRSASAYGAGTGSRSASAYGAGTGSRSASAYSAGTGGRSASADGRGAGSRSSEMQARGDESRSSAGQAGVPEDVPYAPDGQEQEDVPYYDIPPADYYEDPETGDLYQVPQAAVRGRGQRGAGIGAGSRASVIDQGIENSRTLLLNYIVQYPAIYPDVKQFLSATDFGEGFAGQIADLVFGQMEENGKVDQGRIVSHFESQEDQRKVMELFHTMDRAQTSAERVKAVREVMKKVLQAAPLTPAEGQDSVMLTIRRQQNLKKIASAPVHLE